MNNEQNLCIDCKHSYYTPARQMEMYQCYRPESIKNNPVDGKRIIPFCKNMREDSNLCGLEGRYFEPKEAKE